MTEHDLLSLVESCRNEPILDRQIELLAELNNSLPEFLRLKIPSLLTNDYVDRALEMIEDKIRIS
jgi:hypothetical protein